jgi:aspartyl-tRNA(Asn)/glutamyl-tRNA(Gln) amidotransferase subunit C
MALKKADVEHIAHLARLHLTEAEKELFRVQLSDILDHVGALQKLDTTSVPPMNSVVVERARLRKDEAGSAMRRSDLLSNAPEIEDKQFRVPPVLD